MVKTYYAMNSLYFFAQHSWSESFIAENAKLDLVMPIVEAGKSGNNNCCKDKTLYIVFNSIIGKPCSLASKPLC